MVKVITPNRAIALLVFAPIFYYVLTFFIPALVLREVFNSLSFGAYVMITATWLYAFVAALRSGGKEGQWRLILGVFVLALTVTDTRIYNFMYNYLKRPDWLTFSAWPGFWSYSYLLAGLLILSAASDEKDRPIINLIPLILASAIGGAAATMVLMMGVSSFL